ncbi:hypothetical protein, partial [Zhongshania marina]
LNDEQGGKNKQQKTENYAIIWQTGWVNFRCKSRVSFNCKSTEYAQYEGGRISGLISDQKRVNLQMRLTA